VPLCVGGDHTVTSRSCARWRAGTGSFGLVHFDAPRHLGPLLRAALNTTAAPSGGRRGRADRRAGARSRSGSGGRSTGRGLRLPPRARLRGDPDRGREGGGRGPVVETPAPPGRRPVYCSFDVDAADPRTPGTGTPEAAPHLVRGPEPGARPARVELAAATSSEVSRPTTGGAPSPASSPRPALRAALGGGPRR